MLVEIDTIYTARTVLSWRACSRAQDVSVCLPLDPDEFELLVRAIAVVEEQLLAGVDRPFSEDADSVVAVDHDDAGRTVRVDGVIGETNLVSLSGSVDDVVLRTRKISDDQKGRVDADDTASTHVVEVEQEGAGVLVVHLAAPVGLVLRDHLAAVLGNELVLLRRILEKDAPAGNVGRREQQALPCNDDETRRRVSNRRTNKQTRPESETH